MSVWEEQGIEEKIIQILNEIPDSDPSHHLGRPFMTAYQIAIELDQRHGDIVNKLELPIGGRGVGQRTSLAQYLARQLSRIIKEGRTPQIEGGFLSNQHLNDISFVGDPTPIHSSLTETQYTLSMFRLRK